VTGNLTPRCARHIAVAVAGGLAVGAGATGRGVSAVAARNRIFSSRCSLPDWQERRAVVRAVLEAEGEKYSEGYTLVTREDLGSFYYYQPARQRVSIVDVQGTA
jgi:hypothetical protein